jgi:hypothetical protein
MNFIHRSRSKKWCFAAKIGIQKAYDRVNWDFLQSTLEEFRFPQETVKLIMFCVRAPSLTLLWNGSKLPPFLPPEDLGKEILCLLTSFCSAWKICPVLYLRRLLIWLGNQFIYREKGLWSRICFFFADDVLLFAKASTSHMQLMIKVVSDFCNAWSGLKVSLDKSRVLCSKNTSRRERHNISYLCSLKFASSLGNYLGFIRFQSCVRQNWV